MPIPLGPIGDEGYYVPQTQTLYLPQDAADYNAGSTGTDTWSGSGSSAVAVLEKESSDSSGNKKCGVAIEEWDPDGIVSTLLSGTGL